MKFTYYPEGVCTSQIEFEVIDNRIHNVQFTGGCEGNLKGIAALAENMDVDKAIGALSNISCEASLKACPTKFADALVCYKEGEFEKLRPLSQQEILDKQQSKWNISYENFVDMFGEEVSYPVQQTMSYLNPNTTMKVLELGCGQGRDTLVFAQHNCAVTALDYSEVGVEQLMKKATELNVSNKITPITHDVRKEWPFENETYDICYSHMLLNMAFTENDLLFIMKEAYRILKPGGVHIFTVRNSTDAHYEQGVKRGEDLYEMDGFIVHFFTKEKLERLKNDFAISSIQEFEEGELPRKLYYVVMSK